MDLAIVVVSYNTRDLLATCLGSVAASLAGSDLRAQVIVVDNASADDSAAMVRERFPQAYLIANEDNVGFAAANNQALRWLGFGDGTYAPSPGELPRHVLLLNPDTEVRGPALATLVRFLDMHPRAGAAGARLVYPDGRPQHSAFGFPGIAQTFIEFFPLNHRLVNSRLNGRYPARWYEDGPFPVGHPLGACLMVRREAVEQVGLLDDRFYMYCEEIDWCMRIKRSGWGVYCVPQAEVVHHEARSTGQFREKMFVALWRSRFLLYDTHYGPLRRWAIRHIVRLGVRRKMTQARHETMDAGQRERQLAAYRQVMRMAGGIGR